MEARNSAVNDEHQARGATLTADARSRPAGVPKTGQAQDAAALPCTMEEEPSADAVVIVEEDLIRQLLDAEARATLQSLYRRLQVHYERGPRRTG